jgi:hypothetical protein
MCCIISILTFIKTLIYKRTWNHQGHPFYNVDSCRLHDMRLVSARNLSKAFSFDSFLFRTFFSWSKSYSATFSSSPLTDIHTTTFDDQVLFVTYIYWIQRWGVRLHKLAPRLLLLLLMRYILALISFVYRCLSPRVVLFLLDLRVEREVSSFHHV